MVAPARSCAMRKTPDTIGVRLVCRLLLLQVFSALIMSALAIGADSPEGSELATAHWPMWRGPLGNGFAPGAKPPVRWSEQENVRWKTPIDGDGSATPIIWGDTLFVVSAEPTERPAEVPFEPDPRAMTRPPVVYHRFLVWSIQRFTGQVNWKQTACEVVPHEGIHTSHSYAAASPTTDGRHLYVSFGSRGVFCYDMQGNLVWQRQLGLMNTRRGWGEGTSPVLADGLLLVNWDHEDASFLFALDAQTGAIRWQVPRDEVTSWATPAVVKFEGRTQVIVPGTNRVRSYDASTGQTIWECGGQTVNCIPSPIVFEDMVICMSGYRGAAARAISLRSQGDVTDKPDVKWKHDRGTPYVPSAAVDGDRIYFNNANNAILSCLNIRTGEPLIDRQRLSGLSDLYASPLVADGRLYIVDRSGQTVVYQLGDTLQELAANKLDDPIDASPVAVGDLLYLRGRSHLYCLQTKTND